MKIRGSILFLFFVCFSCSFVFANSTGVTTFSQQYTILKQNFSNFLTDISSLSGKNNNNVDLLNCMDVPVLDNATTYISLTKELQSNFVRDFPSILGTESSTDLIRIDFYNRSLESLKASFQKDLDNRNTLINTLLTKNKSLFDQLSSDKLLLNSVVSSYDERSQKLVKYRVLYGYNVNQYTDIVEKYNVFLKDDMEKKLSEIEKFYGKKNNNLSGFDFFLQEEKDIYIGDFSIEVQDFFSKEFGNVFNESVVKNYQIEIEGIQKNFYDGSNLQCSLLTSLNQEKRLYYAKLLLDIKEQQKLLDDAIGSSGTMLSSEGLFSQGSESLYSLNLWYNDISKRYQNSYIELIGKQSNLLKKVARSEDFIVNTFSQKLTEYMSMEEEDKKNMKLELMAQIKSFEKEDIISIRAKKSLEKIKVSLGVVDEKKTLRLRRSLKK